jgi:hypothetical protein
VNDMIIRDDDETYDGKYRFVLYEPDSEGKLAATPQTSYLEDQIPVYYEQRRLEMARLEREVIAGEISPIAMLMTYQQMTLSDLVARAQTSKRHVKAHLTPKGFRELTVAQLQRYARVFGVTVADFFEFIHVRKGVALTAEQRGERLLQLVEAAPAGDGATAK